MRQDLNFLDPSPGDGVYQGDLKYGRRCGGQIVPRKDFTRVGEEGVENLPVHSLPPQRDRDPQVWNVKAIDPETGKFPTFHGSNMPYLFDRILTRGLEYPHGLVANLSMVRRGKEILK